ncbi:MAG: 4-hydroxy-tetrahydrodipicolinate synthase [bacterium]
MQKRYCVGDVVTAMVTPFDKDLKINYKMVEKLANHLVATGTETILVAGTTGESPTLTHDEELELLKVVKSAVSGKAKILIGAGSNSTATAVETSKKVAKAGADAILSVVPYYNKPSQIGMMAHFGAIANAVDLPIMLYNIPGRTGVDMAPETIIKIATEHKNIFAVKQSNSNLDLVTEIISDAPEGFVLYSGDDSLTLPMLALGAVGVVSVASHLIGNEIQAMIKAFKAGNVAEATALHHKYYPVFKKIFMAPNPIPTKAALAKKGLIEETVRLPLVCLDDKQKTELFSTIDYVL